MVKKILVIEDNEKTRNLFLECLEAKGFQAHSADNGLVGLQMIQEKSPDLILCDVKMPKLDGFGVLSELRSNTATAIIPFIFVTAKATRADFRKGMELGANDYLTKPCKLKELMAAITTQLKQQATLQQWYSTEQQTPVAQASSDKNVVAPESFFPACSPMKDVFHFIEANYHQSITLCDVAQAVGYSPAYLTNLVRQQTGKSVHRWLVERRMAQAISLLLKTENTVSQIAESVGYQDVCHFSRYFRQFYGTSPQAWRSAHRRNSA